MCDMTTKDYGFRSLRLKKETLDRLRELKVAFEASRLESMTNDVFIDNLIRVVRSGAPEVWEAYMKIQEKKSV